MVYILWCNTIAIVGNKNPKHNRSALPCNFNCSTWLRVLHRIFNKIPDSFSRVWLLSPASTIFLSSFLALVVRSLMECAISFDTTQAFFSNIIVPVSKRVILSMDCINCSMRFKDTPILATNCLTVSVFSGSASMISWYRARADRGVFNWCDISDIVPFKNSFV